jgi:hypothetical protein
MPKYTKFRTTWRKEELLLKLAVLFRSVNGVSKIKIWLLTAMLKRGVAPCLSSSLGCTHLSHAADDVLRGAVAEGVDGVAEEDGHEGVRHAVGQGPHRAHRYEQQVQAVGVPEHAEQRHLLGRRCALLVLLIFFAVQVAAAGSASCRVHGGGGLVVELAGARVLESARACGVLQTMNGLVGWGGGAIYAH